MSNKSTQAQKLRAAMSSIPVDESKFKEPAFKVPFQMQIHGYDILYATPSGFLLVRDNTENVFRMLRVASRYEVHSLFAHLSIQELAARYSLNILPDEEQLFCLPDDVYSTQQLYDMYRRSVPANPKRALRFGQWVVNQFGNAKYSCSRIYYAEDEQLVQFMLQPFLSFGEFDNATLS